MKTKVWWLCILVSVLVGGGYSYLRFRADAAASDATACVKHGVERCPFCAPTVIAASGFCQEHGVPEAICTRCRVALEAVFRAEGDWCGGHGVPESQCELCNPGVLAKWREAPPALLSNSGIEVATADAPRLLRSPSVDCQTESRIVRLASAEIATRAGLQFAEVTKAPLRQFLEAPAELEYDARHHARLAPRAPGVVVEVCCSLGARVEAGSVLLVVDSPTLGASKSELLQAASRVRLWQQNFAREQQLIVQSLTTQRSVLESETQLAESRIAEAAAEQRLRSLGLDAEQIDAVREHQDTSSRLQVQAPFAGTVVAHTAVVGQSADPATTLVAVADTGEMWAMIDVDQAEVANVAIGQAVLLTVSGLRGETFGGRITWISTEVDPRTRTIKVRAEFANPQGELRSGGFASARIVTRDGHDATLVPKAAVQWEGCCNIVFVRVSTTEFAPRKLRLGYATGDFFEVLAGLDGGEQVVTQGSYLLKTEILKDSIGAGCCDIDHLSK